MCWRPPNSPIEWKWPSWRFTSQGAESAGWVKVAIDPQYLLWSHSPQWPCWVKVAISIYTHTHTHTHTHWSIHLAYSVWCVQIIACPFQVNWSPCSLAYVVEDLHTLWLSVLDHWWRDRRRLHGADPIEITPSPLLVICPYEIALNERLLRMLIHHWAPFWLPQFHVSVLSITEYMC